MALFKINSGEKKLTPMPPSTFAAVSMRERQDLQALLRDNSSAIDPDIFIIAEEFSNWHESLRRVDLLALDKGERTENLVTANLVVIELKRVEEGGHMELQAIRYAAMLSNMDFEVVVEEYKKFLGQRGKQTEPARSQLLQFLGVSSVEQVKISNKPRILLISPSFSKEITTTVLWLNEQDLDIRCLEVNPYKLGNDLYLDLEQVIPLPSADEYIVQRREKVQKQERQASIGRREGTIRILISHGILKPNTKLQLIRLPKPGLVISEEKMKFATFLGDQGIEWDYDKSELYSLSGLCKKICEICGGDIGAGAFAGPDYWSIEGENESLTQRARALEKQTLNSNE